MLWTNRSKVKIVESHPVLNLTAVVYETNRVQVFDNDKLFGVWNNSGEIKMIAWLYQLNYFLAIIEDQVLLVGLDGFTYNKKLSVPVN